MLGGRKKKRKCLGQKKVPEVKGLLEFLTEHFCNKWETSVFEISGLKLHIVLIKLKKNIPIQVYNRNNSILIHMFFLLFPGDFSRDVFDGFSSRTDVEIKPMVPKRCICLQGSCDCCFDSLILDTSSVIFY